MREPVYMKVYNTLRKQIISKKYDVGSILPSEPELEREFDVSRTTVRKAIDMLVREGFLSVRRGIGTKVLSCKTIQNLNKFSSVSESIEKNGYKLGLKRCYIEKIRPTDDIASELELSDGEPVICIHRIKTANGIPICIMKNYISESLVPDFDIKSDVSMLYDTLREKYNVVYSGAKDTISACNATFEQAQLLSVEPNTALFHIRRICYIANRPYEIDEVDIVADMYEYEVFVGDIMSDK